MIRGILFELFLFILPILIYFSISIRLTYKFYLAFSILSYLILGFYIILQFLKLARNKEKTKTLRIIETASIIVSVAVLLYCKNFIDSKNLLILKTSNQNISVRQLMKNFNEDNKIIEEYNSAFKNIQYKDNIVYFTDDFKPAIKLVQAYLDKGSQDNLKLFGDFDIGELKIKFDYDEEIFKKRNSTSSDYAGLYSRKEKTTYIYIEDCYSNALALNLRSAHLRHTILHEYTHHVFYEFLDSNKIPEKKIPAWFAEGVAEYVGYEGDSGYAPKKMVDFDELNTREQWAQYNNVGYSVYDQSHYAVRQLILTKGEEIITDILLKAKVTDFNNAFKAEAGVSLEAYEKALKKDSKNEWKKYNRLVSPEYPWVFYDEEKTEGLEKYVMKNPNNVDALLDLAELYERSDLVYKAKSTLENAINININDSLAWYRLARIHEKMWNFDYAVEAFKKSLSVSENPAIGYINIAHALLLQDVNEAAEAAQKAIELDKSNFIKKQVQAILNYEISIKSGKPYEGCLQLIRSETLNNDNIEKVLIEKLLNEYPHIKNSARRELEKIRGSLG